jgi:aspartokinase-like uncharacterized kinase
MDAVVKIGGSLAEDREGLSALCNKISEYAKKYELIVVPGGGRFADVVRDFDQRFTLSGSISHKMAIMGMDQFGLLLSNITPNSRAFYRLENAPRLSATGKVPILLPSHLMFKKDPLENSWDVTSDSIAAYVASQLHIAKVLLVTDVDGIFTKDPKNHPDAELVTNYPAEKLLKLPERTSVDKFLPKLLLKTQIDCYVINGKHPERIEAILAGQETVCTRIRRMSNCQRPAHTIRKRSH